MESFYRLHGAEIIDSMFLTVKQINNMKRENFIVSVPKSMIFFNMIIFLWMNLNLLPVFVIFEN